MTLIGNKVLVEVEEMKTWRGIHIPEDITHKDNPFMEARIAKVLAVGVGRLTKKGRRIPIDGISVGDRVLLPRSGKIAMDFNGKFCWLMDASEILGKLENAS